MWPVMPWPAQMAHANHYGHQSRCWQHSTAKPPRVVLSPPTADYNVQSGHRMCLVCSSARHRTAEDAGLLLKQRLSECPVCSGSGRVTCKDCSGEGQLPRGGYSRRNPLNMTRAVGSKWTAMSDTLGWRHFRVVAVKAGGKGRTPLRFLLLQASCDSRAQLWVNALTLRNRACWAAGWLQMSELLDADGVTGSSGLKCHTCAGLGFRACSACDGRGRAELVQV